MVDDLYESPCNTGRSEKQFNHTYAADSKDLYHWQPIGPVITERFHEGPNVFRLGGHYWLIIDEWRGQGVYRSDDLTTWERNGIILDQPGKREDDGTIGLHADVVVQGDEGYIFYFTHPGRVDGHNEASGYELRRSSIQVAKLEVVDGVLICDRDKEFEIHLEAQDD